MKRQAAKKDHRTCAPLAEEEATDSPPNSANDPPAGAVIAALPEPSHKVLRPKRQTLPLVLASPHSGRCYPPDFIAAARLDPEALRRSEDSFVEELFDFAPDLTGQGEGAPLLAALFPRAYIDPNREPYELDPAMFADSLPDYANTRSPRVAAGLGTLARIVAGGAEIYRQKLPFSEARGRIERHYRPYHDALSDLVARTRESFGHCLLLDCHSMPSGFNGAAGSSGKTATSRPADFVLGDCHGSACAGRIVEQLELELTAAGYRVARNMPYSGGFVTRHYGRPAEGVHALQIEINRALYMDERRFTRGPDMARLRSDLRRVVAALAILVPEAC